MYAHGVYPGYAQAVCEDFVHGGKYPVVVTIAVVDQRAVEAEMQYEFCLLFGVGAEDLFFCLSRFL